MKRALAICLAVCLALLGVPWYVARADAPIILSQTDEILELVTTTGADVDVTCFWTVNSATAFTPGSTRTAVTTATTTTIVAAPGASEQRAVKLCTFSNRDTTTSQVITIQFDEAGTNSVMWGTTLAPGESAQFSETRAFVRLDSAGRDVSRWEEPTGYTGRVYDVIKVGTGAEGGGVHINYAATSGLPGAWVPGTPGLNGTASNCDASGGAATMGSYILPDPASGAYFLTQATFSSTQGHSTLLVDPIWYNTSIVVTTTTGQAITQPTLGSRDLNGSNNGDGWNAAIFVTTATGNGASVTTITLTYTDSDGNAGNTATMASFPATAVVGTWVPFQLAAGDRGIRSIQTITLGTTLTSGAISLVHYRQLTQIAGAVASQSAMALPLVGNPGVRLYNDTCVWGLYLALNTNAANLFGSYVVMER